MPILKACVLKSTMVEAFECVKCVYKSCKNNSDNIVAPELNHLKLVCFCPEDPEYVGCSVCVSAESACVSDFKTYCMKCSGYQNLVGGGSKEHA